ncbi:hypothetical protein KP509_24G044900 [Ceratopteris richardii]|nr:hypothetical protein KP509_24G044900 [Ceratopteris richardii]
MYSKCGSHAKAQELFNQLANRNVVTWNSLIASYVRHGMNSEALHAFERMQNEGLFPNAITFICILKACCNLGTFETGEKIHSEISKQGFLEKNAAVGTVLIDMYAKCGMISKARIVFDNLLSRNIATWTSLIGGYAEVGLGHEALRLYDQMQHEGLLPNAITFICVLKACSTTGNVMKGEEIHREISRQGLIEKEIAVGNALLHMYAECGALAKAQEVFQELPSWNTTTWTVLISCYLQHGLNDEALSCFDDMQVEGCCPDSVTYICASQACGNLGAVEKGEKLNAMIIKQGLPEDLELGTALVDMYAKGGLLTRAQQVFERACSRNVATWTALISGYAHAGKMGLSSYLLNQMIGEGVKPNPVTFLVLMNACGHVGLVSNALLYFEMMTKSWSSFPSSEHYISIIDVLSRADRIDEAMSTTKYVTHVADFWLWSSLTGACRKWGNMDFARWIFEQISVLDWKLATPYICMQDIYVAAGIDDEVDKFELFNVWNIRQP